MVVAVARVPGFFYLLMRRPGLRVDENGANVLGRPNAAGFRSAEVYVLNGEGVSCTCVSNRLNDCQDFVLNSAGTVSDGSSS
jgi:hypothetical protein